MNDRLPKSLTVPLNDDETTMSFISRVAYLNRRPAREFCRDIGAPVNALASGDREAIDRLAQVTSANATAIEDRLFVKTERSRYQFNGECVGLQGLDFDGMRFCPKCLAEDLENGSGPEVTRPYRRAAWVFSGYKTCTRHETPLLTGHGSALDFAASLHENPKAFRQVVEPKMEACGFEAYLEARLRARSKSGLWLDTFRIDAAARVCEMIGASELFPGRYVSSLDPAESRAAQSCGFNVSSSGPAAIGDLLERVLRRQELPPVTPSEAWPALYVYLRETSDAEYDPLREIVHEVAVNTMPFGKGDTCLGRQVERRIVHSVRTAAKQFGVHPTRLRRLLEKGGFISEASAALLNERVLFSADDSNEFLDLVAESMPWQAAVRYLNLPPRHDRRMLGGEFVQPLVQTAGGRLTQHVLPKRRLDEFLGKLTRNSSPFDMADNRFQSIPSAARVASCHEYDIVRMLVASQLQQVRTDPSERAYKAILVDAEEVSRVISRHYYGMTKRQAEDTIRTASKVIIALIDNGLLDTFVCEKPPKGRRRVALVADSVERFAERYVSLAALCIDTGRHHSAILRALDQNGIEPAFPKELVHTRFYERERVQHLS